MQIIYSGKHALYPSYPTQRFVDEQGHDITEKVTAYDSELFEAMAEHFGRMALMAEHMGPAINALMNFLENGGLDILRQHAREHAEREPEYEFDPAFVPGNNTRH